MTKQDLKNNLRNRTCENCALLYSDQKVGSDWCVMKKVRPESSTCSNWQQSDVFVYTFVDNDEMVEHMLKGKDLQFDFNSSFSMKKIEIRTPDGEPLYYIDGPYEFTNGGGTLTIKAPTIK